VAAYKLISADSHFVEPPRMWAERLDLRFRDRAPHAVKLEGKPGEYFVCEDLAPAPVAAFFSAGVPPAEMLEFMKRGFDEAPNAVHDPAERIRDQDRDGVSAEVIYTSLACRYSALVMPNSVRLVSTPSTIGPLNIAVTTSSV
jgi:uncharacterized protein